MSSAVAAQPLRLTAALRSFGETRNDDTWGRVVGESVGPLGRPRPEADELAKILRDVEHGDDVTEELLTEVAFLELKLLPSGEERANGAVAGEEPPQEGGLDPALVAVVNERLGVTGPKAWKVAERLEYQLTNDKVRDLARDLIREERTSGSRPEREDISAVVRGDLEPLLPTMFTRNDSQSLVYPGLSHLLYGGAGWGKSIVSAAVCVQVLNRGGTVGYLDWEGNRQLVGERLTSLGVNPLCAIEGCGHPDHPDAIAERFHYYRPGNIELHADWLAEQAQQWHLCFFDGVARALVAAGRKENDPGDFLYWNERAGMAVNQAGCATFMLDHTGNDPDARNRARGASSKQGEISGAAWELRRGHPFNRSTAGFVRLIQWKDRSGYCGKDGDCVVEVHFTPRRGGTDFEFRVPATAARDIGKGMAMEKAWKAVRAIADTGVVPNTSAVHRIIGGDKSDVGDMLKELADLGHLRKHSGARGAHEWEPVTPYLAPAAEPPPGPPDAYYDGPPGVPDPDELF